MIKIGLLLAGVWFVLRRFGLVFWLYGCLLAVLIVLGGRKALFGLTRADFADSVTSPMSLLRWGLLGLTALSGYFVRRAPFRASVAAQQLAAGTVAFVLLCVASSAYATDPRFSLMRGASLVLLAALLLWTFYPLAHDTQHCDRLMRVYQLAALGVVCVNAYLLVQGRGFVLTHLGMSRFGGLLENPIQLSTFVTLTAPICILMARRHGWLSWHGGLVAGLLVSVVLTHARAGLLSVAVGVALFWYLVEDKAKRPLWVAAGLLAGPLLLSLNWARTLAREQGDSFWEVFYNARLAIWFHLFRYFKASPWLGHGLGCSHLFNRYVIKDVSHADMHVHNSYLEVFGDLGAVGLVLMLGPLLIVCLHGRKALSEPDRSTPEMNAALFATVIAGLVDAVCDSWLLSVGNNSCVMFWVLVAALIARADVVVLRQGSATMLAASFPGPVIGPRSVLAPAP